MIMGKVIILSNAIRAQLANGNRNFFDYLKSSFNMYDQSRVKEVGPDRAAAEWLIKNGAFVRWQGGNVVKDYNQIGISGGKYIEGIDCTDSSVNNAGFQHLKGLKHVREIKLVKCWDVGDGALRHISESVADTLQNLEVISTVTTEQGLLSVRNVKGLKQFRVGNLPEIENIEKVVQQLKKEMPNCNVELVAKVDESHKKKKKGWFG